MSIKKIQTYHQLTQKCAQLIIITTIFLFAVWT